MLNKRFLSLGKSAAEPYQADFLVLAGGGGASNNVSLGNGAGAGGYRTSYGTTSGGGGSAESKLDLIAGATYTITVGAGGTSSYSGLVGNDSSISNAGTMLIESLKGGALDTLVPVGSGSGEPRKTFPRTLGTANQGYDGGFDGAASGSYAGSGGGGGGAGGNGGNGSANFGGNGGAGLSNSITGSSIGRGGGGAGMYYSSGCYWTDGNLEIGPGTASHGGSSCSGSPAAANKGGGGHCNSSSIYRNGGSGVVILRVPTANYSGITTGSPSISQIGTDTIIQFTGSGSYTA